MNLNKLLYSKSLEINASNGDDRSDRPFRISLSKNQAIQIRRVVFDIYNDNATKNAGQRNVLAAISCSDLKNQSDVADTSSYEAFQDRQDIVVSQILQDRVATAVGIFYGPSYQHDFEEGEIVLPRSPSGILFTFDNAGNDNYGAFITIYYQKVKVSNDELTKLFMKYPSRKGAQPARVIDE